MFAGVPLLQQFVDKLADKLVMSFIVAAAGGVLVWPFKSIKRKVEEFTAELKAVQTELVTQRTNCLTTIQMQGKDMVDLQGRTVKILENMHTTQAEMSGYLKARKG